MLSEIGRFLQSAHEPEGDGDVERRVEQLTQRVSEAVLLPDRRAALQELKDLLVVGNARAQMAFGNVGFPAALHVVREREDLEMVQLALESLAVAVGGYDGGGHAAPSQVRSSCSFWLWRPRLLLVLQHCNCMMMRQAQQSPS